MQFHCHNITYNTSSWKGSITSNYLLITIFHSSASNLRPILYLNRANHDAMRNTTPASPQQVSALDTGCPDTAVCAVVKEKDTSRKVDCEPAISTLLFANYLINVVIGATVLYGLCSWKIGDATCVHCIKSCNHMGVILTRYYLFSMKCV